MRIVLVQQLFLAAALTAAGPITLDPAALQPHNVKVEKVAVYRRNPRVIRVADAGSPDATDGSMFAVFPGTSFADGVIELDVAGDLVEKPAPDARGFVGIAFRMQPDLTKYEAFYLRPLNGRAEDQERRNHSVQYISNPEFGWQRLRKETPSRYETYTDIEQGEWAHLKVEVKADKARLYVNRAAQPTLIVNDLKHGASKGMLALWVGPSTVAYFANLQVR